MAAITPVDVGNMALDILTEGSITSLEQNTRAARLLHRNIDISREAMLTQHAWNFALVRLDTTPVDTAVEGMTRYRFAKPDDALRVLPLRTGGYPHGLDIQYTAYADGFYSPVAESVPIVYIANMIDPSEMPAEFVRVWSADLALTIAHALTGKSSMVDKAAGIKKQFITEAKKSNAIAKGYQLPPESFAEARGDPDYRYNEARR